MKHFQSCIGAVDGTHIPIFISGGESQKPWFNRKGWMSQNVMATCDFDLKFTFIHAGWQGSAHDAMVLRDAIMKKRFIIPQGRYYLADAGFFDCDFLMRPYPQTRYHLREWHKKGVDRPQKKEELFNLRHSQLRVFIERIFGVAKRKFKILAKPAEYSIQQQIHLVLALTAVFNFIAARDRKNDLDFSRRHGLRTVIDIYDPPPPAPPIASQQITKLSEKERAKQRRDEIAEKMWDDYLKIRSARQRAAFLEPPDESDTEVESLGPQEEDEGEDY
jgi:hypothetical protein